MCKFLHSTESKIARGKIQAKHIIESISNWCDSNPFSLRCELREERLGFKLIINKFPDEPPFDEWGLNIGECVHNLRSALDNLAFALARLNCDPPVNPTKIYFPIYQNLGDFNKNASRKIDQLSNDAIEIIKNIQPFNRDNPDVEGSPEEDPLVLLQWLSNTDKHQVPSVILVAPKEFGNSHSYKFYSAKDADLNVPPNVTFWVGALEPDITIMELKTISPIESASGELKCSAIVAMQTCYGNLPVVDVITQLTNYTELVVTQFREMFK